jgi:hypothetical protein
MACTQTSLPGCEPAGAGLELWYYYGAGGQFPNLRRVASVEQAEQFLATKKYHSAELFSPGSNLPLKSWERGEP